MEQKTQERLPWECEYLFVPKWEKIERKDWKKRLKVYFPKKRKTENKTTEGVVVINNIALPEMLLTSSPVQQFLLFFSSHFDLFIHSSRLNSS